MQRHRGLINLIEESETKRQALALLHNDADIHLIIEFLHTRRFDEATTINFLFKHTRLSLSESRELVAGTISTFTPDDENELANERLKAAAHAAGFVFVPLAFSRLSESRA